MAKYIAAVLNHGKKVEVLKCDGQTNLDPKKGEIQVYGRIVGRLSARNYGDALDIANHVEGNG